MLREPATRAGIAPTVDARRGVATALVVSGLTARREQLMRIKMDGKFVTLGTKASDANGMAQFPGFRLLQRGTYVISITDRATGQTRYIKVNV